MIDKTTLEIHRDNNNGDDEEEEEKIHTTMSSIADALPDNQPRFVVLSYPLTLVRP